jgi:4-hydroxymandelate synthase
MAAARDIEYVELYASDARSVVGYFVHSLGFTQVARSAGDSTQSALLRQGTVQLLVTSGPGTRQFLDARGDGVADIALSCDDVAAVRAAAVAAGASVAGSGPGFQIVSGVGGIRHTLLPASAAGRARLPAGRTWIPALVRPIRPSGRITLLDHVAICLEGQTLAQRADFYLAAFGLARSSCEYVAVGAQEMDSIVVRSPSGGVTFTLVAPDPAKSPGQLDAFLVRNDGPGVQHLAFGVDDIVAAAGEFRRQGVEFLRPPDSYYDTLGDRRADMRDELADLRAENVLADCYECGYLLQLFTRSPYRRNTLFYELIQRRGRRQQFE